MITGHRDPDSPWNSAFCHTNELADGLQPDELLNRDTVLEFYLRDSGQKNDGIVAQNVPRVQTTGR